MKCSCGEEMRATRKVVRVDAGKHKIPLETTVWVCRGCGNKVANLRLAFDGEVVEMKGDDDGKVK